MKHPLNRIFAFLVALVFCVGLFAVPAYAAEYSGSCGDGLTWSFADGRLTITGSGDMTDYNQIDMPPWYEFREQIFYLSLPEGLTTVGAMAFYDCYNLTAINIPASVTDIGRLAFCQCRNVTILKLSDGLLSIGRSAFEQCEKLQDVRLPNTLTSLGYHAFYRCAGLQHVTIPASVAEMDSGVFAYCDNLVQVEIEAPLESVPSWTFYGCDNLTSVVLPEETVTTEDDAFTGCEKLDTVYYPGSEENAQQLKEQIGKDDENFGKFGTVTNEPADTAVSVNSSSKNSNGQVVVHDTTVTKTENATVSTTTNTVVSGGEKTADAEVTATVVTDEGWQALIDAILAAQKELETKENAGMETGKVDVDVYVTENSGVPKDVLDTVAGSNVDMTVQTESGAKFTVTGSTLEVTEAQDKLELSYAVAYMAAPDFETLNGIASYKLKFYNSSDVKVEVMIRVPTAYARKTASLYQVNGRELELLQNVMVDTEGYAHFYLASVNKDTDYRIGIDVKGIDQNSVIIPGDLHAEYGVTDMVFASDMYVITGRQSAWGVNMTQVTIILMAVMVVSAVAVGVFMYIRNKKKLAAGYVPDISEEDLEE